MSNVFRSLPSVNELLDNPALKKLVDRASRNVVVSGVRSFLDNLRRDVENAAADFKVPTPSDLAEKIADWIATGDVAQLRPVINATGILLPTGLGRAPLADEAVQAVMDVARGYSSLDVDLATGDPSPRVRDAERLLKELTGAEAAAIVNNHAGAALLTLSALARGKEVIVSRGQLGEVGGSYRLPDVMEHSGAILREVGTTNTTRIDDYRAAIGPDTAALLRLHSGNYAIVGFTERAPFAELVEAARKNNVLMIDAVGSGAISDPAPYGVTGEPLVVESVKAGTDVVLFSGDELLGGPQCGIILGKKPLIKRITDHPLARALQVDKLTLAALIATLRLHLDRTTAERSLPLFALLSTALANLQNRAERMAPQLASCSAIAAAEPVQSQASIGGESLPSQQIDTWCVALTPAKGDVRALAKQLRCGVPSIFGRIQKDRLLLDLRTVFPRQDMQVVEAIQALGTPQEPALTAEK